ncbi:HNH endonuclease signature motif containing protein [Virgibacillus soli]|uniref:HNH endonuclease signature motif containing protein n=1 Tax=Paracerasibacillus soli TaxID=480284 RepID=A0ABU5CUC4_9BACI|nr:HNH endonuclease signature motif containing protein [Virgibacillus soli]MDY0409963.1 HNH endonuclease signature motif containing protein [Virgibacillus soli]
MENKKIETRICRLCNEEKALDLFEVDKRVKGGITTRCKACKSGLNDKARTLYARLKYRAEQDGQPLKVTLRQLRGIFAAFDGKCIYCGKSEDEAGRSHHVDHVIATSAGGSHHISNLVLACASCNLSKSDKPFFEFYLRKRAEIGDENFAMLTYFISLTSGQPTQEVINSFLLDYIKYAHEDMSGLFDDKELLETIRQETNKRFMSRRAS